MVDSTKRLISETFSAHVEAYRHKPLLTASLLLTGCAAACLSYSRGSRLLGGFGVGLILIPLSCSRFKQASFQIGKLCRELQDLSANARIYWCHSDLSDGKEKKLTLEQVADLKISLHDHTSEFFLFRGYRFNVGDLYCEDGSWYESVAVSPVADSAPSLSMTFYTMSLWVLGKGVGQG
jgi:hypothetical protein